MSAHPPKHARALGGAPPPSKVTALGLDKVDLGVPRLGGGGEGYYKGGLGFRVCTVCTPPRPPSPSQRSQVGLMVVDNLPTTLHD